MKLPPHLRIDVDHDSATPGQRLLVQYYVNPDGSNTERTVVLGSYNPKYQSTAWSYRTTTGAWGETATEWGAVVTLYELGNLTSRIAQREKMERMTYEEWRKLFVRFGGLRLMSKEEDIKEHYDQRLDHFDVDTFHIKEIRELREVAT